MNIFTFDVNKNIQERHKLLKDFEKKIDEMFIKVLTKTLSKKL